MRNGTTRTLYLTWAASISIATTAQGADDTSPPPLIPGTHWHHFHINSTDPSAAIEFYIRHFDAKAAKFAGSTDAVWAQRSWLLFEKVSTKPSTAHNTAIWHVGWGAPDPKAEFERQTELGAKFRQPLTDISTGLGGKPDRFYYMYVESPDGTWIELNTARSDDFGHLHLFSADPVAAGDWYKKFFGVTARASPAPRTSLTGLQVGPSSSLYFDNVNIIIYPVEYARKVYAAEWPPGQSRLAGTRGNVNDHIGVSVPDLDQALTVALANGVQVLRAPAPLAPQVRSAFIEGPDNIAIELLEDRSAQPAEER